MNFGFTIRAGLILICLINFCFAQDGDPSILTVDRIYKSKEFSTPRRGQFKWAKDGESYTKLDTAQSGSHGKDLVRYDFRTGKRQIVVPAEKLIPAGQFIPLKVRDYYFSEDEKHLLVFTNTKRVWRRHTRGDYWVLNLTNWKLEKLGGNALPSTLMFATF